MEGPLLGYALVAVAVASWTVAPALVSRLASREPGLDPLAFNAWRMVFAAAALAPAALALGPPWAMPLSDPAFQAGLLAGGVVGAVLGDAAFVYAVARVGACVAVPVSYLFVVWSAIVDAALGEAPAHVVAAASLCVAGVWLVQSGAPRRDPRGLAAAAAASLAWTAANYGYKTAVALASEAAGGAAGWVGVAFLRSLYAAAAMAPALRRWDVRRGLPETLGASLAGYVVGALAYIAALDLLPVSLVSIGLSANPVLVQLAARAAAGERPGPRVVAGSALVGLSIGLSAAAAPARPGA